jgi:hypothetical protein
MLLVEPSSMLLGTAMPPPRAGCYIQSRYAFPQAMLQIGRAARDLACLQSRSSGISDATGSRMSSDHACHSIAMFLVSIGALCMSGGCFSTEAFVCTSADQCLKAGQTGTCEPSGYCSYADATCDSGSRYGESAGGGLAGTCVGASPGSDGGGRDNDGGAGGAYDAGPLPDAQIITGCTSPDDCAPLTDTCGVGECNTATGICSKHPRNTGVTCGATNCGGFGDCGGFDSDCDTTGTQSRTCTPQVCASGNCTTGGSYSESQECSRASPCPPQCSSGTCAGYNPGDQNNNGPAGCVDGDGDRCGNWHQTCTDRGGGVCDWVSDGCVNKKSCVRNAEPYYTSECSVNCSAMGHYCDNECNPSTQCVQTGGGQCTSPDQTRCGLAYCPAGLCQRCQADCNWSSCQ